MTKKRSNKELFLEAFSNSAGNISHACKSIGVSRQAYYNWIDNDPNFAKKTQDILEDNIDLAETMLMKNIRDGKEASIFFFLKTKGKSRGYIETVEQRITDPFIDLIRQSTSGDNK